jgi:hypothetical protein
VDDKLRARMGEAGWRFAESRDWSVVADRVVLLYEEVRLRPVSSSLQERGDPPDLCGEEIDLHDLGSGTFSGPSTASLAPRLGLFVPTALPGNAGCSPRPIS